MDLEMDDMMDIENSYTTYNINTYHPDNVMFELFPDIPHIFDDIDNKNYSQLWSNPIIENDLTIISPQVPRENLFYINIPIKKKINKKINSSLIELKKFKNNEWNEFIEFNVNTTIKLLGSKIPFHLYIKVDQQFEYFGSIIEIRKNHTANDRTKILFTIASDDKIFNKTSEANEYLRKKLNKEHHRFIASVYYECDEGKEKGMNNKKTLSHIFCKDTRQGKKITASPDVSKDGKVSYAPIQSLLPLKCISKKTDCKCKIKNKRKI